MEGDLARLVQPRQLFSAFKAKNFELHPEGIPSEHEEVGQALVPSLSTMLAYCLTEAANYCFGQHSGEHAVPSELAASSFANSMMSNSPPSGLGLECSADSAGKVGGHLPGTGL